MDGICSQYHIANDAIGGIYTSCARWDCGWMAMEGIWTEWRECGRYGQ
jgi:hypothetical protein